MKILLFICALPGCFGVFAQDTLAFDLTVRVVSIQDKSERVESASVRIYDQHDSLVFQGCTDAHGEMFTGPSVIQPNSSYKILLEQDAFYADKRGVRFTTVGLTSSQHCVIDAVLLVVKGCGQFRCASLGELSDPGAVAYGVCCAREDLLAEYTTMVIDTIGLWISFATPDQQKQLLKAAGELRRELRREMPDVYIDPTTRIDFLSHHEHDACLRPGRMGRLYKD